MKIVDFKKLFTRLTGYWVHKQSTLPIGSDLFYDIQKRLRYPNLDIIFDVGANEGQTIDWIRHHLSGSAVYCFEPVKKVYEILKYNTSSVRNCVIENIAFGEKSGTKEIALYDELSVLNSLRDDLMNPNKNSVKETICISTIDEYCIQNNIKNIDLLKIDTEGYEMNVLEGAFDMLKGKKISFIFCEVGFLQSNKRNTSFSELCEYLSLKGFNFYSLYQMSDHDWKNGNVFANALFVNKLINT